MTTETTEKITASKALLCHALRKFINQRSGIEYGNYKKFPLQNGSDGERESFLRDYRPILKHGRHARTLLRYVELSGITAEQLIEATSAYAGRLQFIQRKAGDVGVDYTTGQYFPTEYRNAACAVLALAIWNYWMPDYKTGDEIRKRARREFGRAIQATWFN